MVTERTVYFAVDALDGSTWGDMKPTAEKALSSAQDEVADCVADGLDPDDAPKRLGIIRLAVSAPTTELLAAGLAALHGHGEEVDEDDEDGESAAMLRAVATWRKRLARAAV